MAASQDYDVKHRPNCLEEVVGQPEAVATIRGWDHVPRAILFHGQTGCGKTTLARIVCRTLLGVGVDPTKKDSNLIEMNCGAIESAPETVRDLAFSVSGSPIGAKYRVWILDEFQSFGVTNRAQNGLLKILEECPAHAVFMLCTTDPEKLIKPIRGRCKPVAVKPVAPAALIPLLKRVAKAEAIDPEPEARLYDRIAEKCQGSVRDALANLQNVAGIADHQTRYDTVNEYAESKIAFDLAKELMPFRGTPNWTAIQKLLVELKDESPETCRRIVLATARTRLLNPKTNADEGRHYYKVIRCLDQPLFDASSGNPLLAAACFQIVFGK